MATPLCPYFGKCGGCTSQQIEYATQLEQKKKQLSSSLGNIQSGHIEVIFDKEYFYRNRMDFIFHKDGLGLRQKGNWDTIVDIPRCVISDEKINKLLKEVRDFFTDVDHFDLKKQSGTFKYCVIRIASDTDAISFVLNEDSSRLQAAGDRIREFAEKTTAKNVIISYVPAQADVSISSEFFVVKGDDMLYEYYMGKKFYYSAQGFFQNNHAMAEKMQHYVHDLLKKHDTAKAHLLDLYAGVGTFGIVNAELFKSVTIVESIKECIDAATKNIESNNIAHAKAIVMDAKRIKRLPLQHPLFVITDPPRSGMDEATIQELNILKPKVIIYVSCNVEQLHKDIPKFKEYTVKTAALLDLFPQTPHSEAVIELVLKTKDEF